MEFGEGVAKVSYSPGSLGAVSASVRSPQFGQAPSQIADARLPVPDRGQYPKQINLGRSGPALERLFFFAGSDHYPIGPVPALGAAHPAWARHQPLAHWRQGADVPSHSRQAKTPDIPLRRKPAERTLERSSGDAGPGRRSAKMAEQARATADGMQDAVQGKPCWPSQSDTRLWPHMPSGRRRTLRTTPRTPAGERRSVSRRRK